MPGPPPGPLFAPPRRPASGPKTAAVQWTAPSLRARRLRTPRASGTRPPPLIAPAISSWGLNHDCAGRRMIRIVRLTAHIINARRFLDCRHEGRGHPRVAEAVAKVGDLRRIPTPDHDGGVDVVARRRKLAGD